MSEDYLNYLHREVYAKFGLAYFFSECIHRQLCNFYVFKDLDTLHDTIRPRLEEKMKYAYSMTLGRIYDELKDDLDENTIKQMDLVVEKRNYIAHHFWFEKCNMMNSITNLEQLLEELDDYVEFFKMVDEWLTKNYRINTDKLGVTEEMLQIELDKVLAGEPYEKLPELRFVKKNEKIVNVWNSPTNDKRSLLIFEAEDGLLLQLSDIGLSWYYGKINDNWKLNEEFSKYLPALFNVRPEIEKPWNYKIKIENKAILQITKEESSAKIGFILKEI